MSPRSTGADLPPIRLLVVDDHTLFRRGLTALLARASRLRVVGDAADAGEALRKAQELKPDIILLDNHLPGVKGVDALPALREAAPGARILMLTVSEDEADLADALRGGAAGYLLKNMEGDALTAAILRTMEGDSIVAPEMTSKLVAAYRFATAPAGDAGRPEHTQPVSTATGPAPAATSTQAAISSLSPRELDVLRGIARGASNKEIGREHGIAETTVKIHVQHILRKLDVSSRVHAAVIASESGLDSGLGSGPSK
jgi:two-component system nitrate/nitrite response regulator NarL